jgi:hypothetical protein
MSAAKVIVRKVKGRGLVPVDERGQQLFDRVPNDSEVVIQMRTDRNLKHERLFNAILDFIRHNAINPATGEMMFNPGDSDKKIREHLKDLLKWRVGEFDRLEDPFTGGKAIRLRSIANMDGIEFSAFFDRAAYVITEEWMPEGTQPEDVRLEIQKMIVGRDKFR